MPTFYIVPPRKTQLGEFGISISGIFGIKTNLPNNAPITSAGALQLDESYSPTWTGQHIFNNVVTFTDNVIFNGDQAFGINSLYIAGQTAGDIIYFNGRTWNSTVDLYTIGLSSSVNRYVYNLEQFIKCGDYHNKFFNYRIFEWRFKSILWCS